MAASQHMRSKRGFPEVVVYQQLTKQVASNEVTDDNAVSKNNEMLSHTRIMANIRQKDETSVATVPTTSSQH